MSDMASVIEKIRKLRALATSQNEHEAAAAAAAAERLLQEHRLCEAQIETAGSAASDPTDSDIIGRWGDRVTTWQAQLLSGLCREHGCAMVYDRDRGMGPLSGFRDSQIARVFGRRSDLQTVSYLYAWLMTEVTRLCHVHGKGLGKSWANAYCMGAVSGIREAMASANRQARAVATSTALVRLDERMTDARHALRDMYPHTSKRSLNGTVGSGQAYSMGQSHGRSIHTGTSLGSGAPKMLGR